MANASITTSVFRVEDLDCATEEPSYALRSADWMRSLGWSSILSLDASRCDTRSNRRHLSSR